jgi:hypothetical protein
MSEGVDVEVLGKSGVRVGRERAICWQRGVFDLFAAWKMLCMLMEGDQILPASVRSPSCCVFRFLPGLGRKEAE